MRLNFTAFTAAVRAHLSPSVAVALPEAAAALYGATPTEIADRAAGTLLLRAIVGPTAGVSLDLASLHVPLAVPLELPAADALEHFTFAPWTGETLADAITKPIVAGVRALDLDTNAPAFGRIEIGLVEGVLVAGAVNLNFPIGDQKLTTTARYGPLSAYRVFQTYHLAGCALLDVGVAARAQVDAPPPPAPVALGSLVEGGGTVH